MTQMDINKNGHQINQSQDDDSIDLKKIIFRFLRNWYWFAFVVAITLGMAFLYNRYTTPIYEISSSLLVEEEKAGSPLASGAGGSSEGIFQGLGMMNSMRNIYNQMVILNSTPIVSRTLNELDFEVSYYAVGRVAVSERYKEVPFQVVWDEEHPQVIDADFFLTIEPNGKLKIDMEEEVISAYSYTEEEVVKRIPGYSFSRTIDPGTKITSDEFSFTILLNELFDSNASNNYKFRFNSKKALLKRYREQLDVTLNDKETSILNLTLRDFNVKKGVDFLNKLTEVYQLDNLEKKNENANRTIQFISSQLQSISDSLSISESRMETFQSEHQVLDISMQSQQLLEQMRELDEELVTLETQNK